MFRTLQQRLACAHGRAIPAKRVCGMDGAESAANDGVSCAHPLMSSLKQISSRYTLHNGISQAGF